MFLDKRGLMCSLHPCPCGSHFRGEVLSDARSDSPYCGHVWGTSALVCAGLEETFNSDTGDKKQHRTNISEKNIIIKMSWFWPGQG